MTDPDDAVYNILFRSLVPDLIASPGLSPHRLRGVVRSSPGSARVLVTADEHPGRGSGLQFVLSHDHRVLNIPSAIRDIRRLINDPSIIGLGSDLIRDSHSNEILPAERLHPTTPVENPHRSEGLVSLINTLTGAGNVPTFAASYEVTGFMLLSGLKCRIYIGVPGRGGDLGIDFPLMRRDGHVNLGLGANLPQELAVLARTGDLVTRPVVDTEDDYCEQAFDFSSSVDPQPPDPAKSRSRHRIRQ